MAKWGMKWLAQASLSDRGRSFWKWSGIEGKTGWDWMELGVKVSIPILLFAGTQFISQQDTIRQREIAEEARQDEVVSKYIESMRNLILDYKLDGNSEPRSKEAAVARTLTLTSLSRLGSGVRKAEILQFLYESGLISTTRLDPAVSLSRADLIRINLKQFDLRRAKFNGANLSGADLSESDLRGAEFFEANLGGADLSESGLSTINFGGANLSGANLSGAYLAYSTFNGADLTGVRWDEKTAWPDIDVQAAFRGAKNIPPELKKQLGLD